MKCNNNNIDIDWEAAEYMERENEKFEHFVSKYKTKFQNKGWPDKGKVNSTLTPLGQYWIFEYDFSTCKIHKFQSEMNRSTASVPCLSQKWFFNKKIQKKISFQFGISGP